MLDFRRGAVAQSGERLTGSQKVVGSNPISSTNKLSEVKRYLPILIPTYIELFHVIS